MVDFLLDSFFRWRFIRSDFSFFLSCGLENNVMFLTIFKPFQLLSFRMYVSHGQDLKRKEVKRLALLVDRAR